jgi:hypothetical protein
MQITIEINNLHKLFDHVKLDSSSTNKKAHKMKKVFSKKYIRENKGCYSESEVEAIPCINEKITLEKLFQDLPFKDFVWFFTRKCDLSEIQKKYFALECVKIVLPVYELRYPNDNRVRNCIEKTELYLKSECSIEELCAARFSFYDDASANLVADAAAYAVAYAVNIAAAAAEDDDVSAAVAAAAAAAYAIAVVYAVNKEHFKKEVWKLIRGLK